MASSRLRCAAAAVASAPLVPLRACVLVLAATGCTEWLYDDGSYHDGDVVIANAGDVEKLAKVETITGDLTIRGTSLRAIDIPFLYAVRGSVLVEDNPALVTLQIPLGFVGNLTIRDNPALDEVRLSSTVGSPGEGRVVVAGNHALTDLRLRAQYLAEIEVADNAGLGVLRFDAGNVGSISVSGNAALPHLGVYGHDGALTVTDMAALETLALVARHSTALTIQRCASLGSINLTSQESIGDLRVDDNANLRGITMPALTTVTGAFEVTSNPKVRRCELERLLTQLVLPPATITLTGNDETACAM